MEKYFISLFLLLFVAEIILDLITKKELYSLYETLENIGISAVSMCIDYGFTLLSVPLLYKIYMPNSFVLSLNKGMYFFILFVCLDFIEYWFHRLSHKIPLMWSAHKVHHQSEHFNLSAGLRTSFLIPIFNIGFYCVLPLLGFKPKDIITLIFLQGFYQLLIHTKLIGKLGYIDNLFITPSVHRVHHGKNEIYLDKNFGKVLALWDKIFNTYERETITVIYGAKDAKFEHGIIHSQIIPLIKWWKKVKRIKNK
jgi:sterol desaturase/sphingolipid hydroxylase (fatty acid hydroxylase superfamily)